MDIEHSLVPVTLDLLSLNLGAEDVRDEWVDAQLRKWFNHRLSQDYEKTYKEFRAKCYPNPFDFTTTGEYLAEAKAYIFWQYEDAISEWFLLEWLSARRDGDTSCLPQDIDPIQALRDFQRKLKRLRLLAHNHTLESEARVANSNAVAYSRTFTLRWLQRAYGRAEEPEDAYVHATHWQALHEVSNAGGWRSATTMGRRIS